MHRQSYVDNICPRSIADVIKKAATADRYQGQCAPFGQSGTGSIPACT